MKLAVNEIFGPTIQGEGPYAGQPAVFLRTAGCNLSCGWCDTPYSWDWKRHDRASEVHSMSSVEVAGRLRNLLPLGSGRMLVITGGEPLLQEPVLCQVVSSLQDYNRNLTVQVETNGTKLPGPMAAVYVVSPKLSASGQPPLDEKVLATWGRISTTYFKWVVSDPSELEEVDAQVRAADLRLSHCYLMPEGTDSETLDRRLRWLADAAVERGYQLSDRLQVRAWGKERGR